MLSPRQTAPNHPVLRRRDFLAGVGALGIGFPLCAKAALASTPSTVAPAGAAIARLAIYPAIGICRVGGSDEWFLAPEVPGLPPSPEGDFKDGSQLLKKQVQRFRVYAFDDHGRVIGEVTSAQADISWKVHVANTKAAWYGFNNPLDNGALAPGLPGQLRNQSFVSPAEREKMLLIDGGATRIGGAGTNPAGKNSSYVMAGRFWGKETVRLGHLRTDVEGRLLVFPADGRSESPVGAAITSFADNDGWHDDWCDGPVHATITLGDGRKLEADSAWVASVGPNFAPEIPPFTTLYDLIEDMNIKQGWSNPPSLPLSFRRHIYPAFRRLALMEWVASSAYLARGWLDIGNFSDPAFIARLADPSPANATLRKSVFAAFRNPHEMGSEAFVSEQKRLPYMLGEGINYDGSPLQWFQMPELQYANLRHWANGDFVNDLEDARADAVTRLDDIPVDQQPAALTEAALEPCAGGAFHPGVELSYYMRLPQLYARAHGQSTEPFRIARGMRPSLLHDLGRLLTPEAAMNGNQHAPPAIGPQMPGDLTRWMGLPWQCDVFSCQQVLLQEDFPTAVWWPTQLPVDVLPEIHYRQLLRTDLTAEERLRFFHTRVAWSRGVAGIGYHANASYWDGITNMIALWQRMGFVVKKPAPSDPGRPAGIPDELFVEVGRGNMETRFDWRPKDGQLPK